MIAAITVWATGFILMALAWQDLRRRRLPNKLVASYAAAFLPYAVAAGLGWPEFGWHVAAAAVTFAVALIFYALGWLGGGDVKLWAGLMLWAGPALALPAALVATVSGAILGIACWIAQKLIPRVRHPVARRPLRLLTAERGVPYGVALAAAGLLVLWARY